ncbi:MAG: hypothetical protein LBJ14_10435 [Desulfarculales bacterium]|jgi:hypothetical protein|nr:hypothetical protein [Desulfarculales bacterium]
MPKFIIEQEVVLFRSFIVEAENEEDAQGKAVFDIDEDINYISVYGKEWGIIKDTETIGQE